MSKTTKLIIGVIVLGIIGYLVFRWYQNRSGQADAATGSNLSSQAPELIGGSSGPDLGPAVSIPLNVTLTQSAPPPSNELPAMETGTRMPSPMQWQRMGAAVTNGAGPDQSEIPEDTGGP